MDRDDELRQMVQEIDEDAIGLTTWEVEFIADLIDGNWQRFTDRQAEIIERIYDERL